MMPEEWPIAAAAADPNAPAPAAGGDRLATVRADFFLDPAQRLTEQERALMTAMLHCLIGDIADEVRGALPNGWAPANDDGNVGLIGTLTASRLLDQPQLMALLLRRADEERIMAAARGRTGRRDARALQGLVSHENGAVSAAAMALILGRGRRRDRFGQCLIAFDDLPLSTAEALVHAIAAAMRGSLASAHGAAAADRQLSAVTAGVIASHDPARSMSALTAMLVHLLDEVGKLEDKLIVAAAYEGEAAFVAEALGRRAGIGGNAAIDELLSGNAGSVMALLRMAGTERDFAAGFLAGFGDLLGLSDPGHAINIFDNLPDAEVEASRTWMGTATVYRSAVAALGMDHGQRTG